MEYIDVLISLGLSRDEAGAYVALLELGPGSPTQIERRARMYRPAVYKALASLQARGLVVAAPRGKRKAYAAESPDKLTGIFKKVEDGFLSAIEDLHALYRRPASPRPVVTYAQSDQAIRDGYMDVIESLKKDGVYYRYSPGYELFDHKRFLPKQYREMRDKKGLERFVIVNDDGRKHSPSLGKHAKSVPRSFDLFDDRIGLTIYEDKVLIVDYESQSAITIAHQKFAEFQRKLFKLLYSKL